ncbi:hypothetical protein ACHAWC_011323 [Mediolabrus comicus]
MFPLLSRTYKLKRKNHKRKRGETRSDLTTFEIRPTKDKNGVGMFAISNIACGDIIISNEEPIVQCSSRPNRAICSFCATPIGTLRKDHLMVPYDLSLPFLDGDDDDPNGLVFTTSHVKCHQCKDTVWCSDLSCQTCKEQQHTIICPFSKPLKDFYDSCSKDTVPIFQLATKAVLVALSHFISASREEHLPIDQFYWWRDYGSHPLWWEVGGSDSKCDKKDKATRFVSVLQNALIQSAVSKKINVSESIVCEICSINHVGSILGMLQCNVMQYEYPSPAGQFLEQINEMLEDLEEQKIVLDEHVDCGSIIGSGLYPLLSLANHNCNPNASIEFLSESNRGSMVATRNISEGEEICITYVCNGGIGSGDSTEYFRQFHPTRTWKWLNDKLLQEGGDGDEQEDSEDEDEADQDANDGGERHSCDSSNNEGVKEDEEPNNLEGSTVTERAKALIEYGFQCKCALCLEQLLPQSS